MSNNSHIEIQKEILATIERLSHRQHEVSKHLDCLIEQARSEQRELHYFMHRGYLEIHRLFEKMMTLEMQHLPEPDSTPGEWPALSPEELNQIREVLSRKSVSDAISGNAPACPELRDLPVCNTIPYGNPTSQCHPKLVITPNAQNAMHCLGQALQHLGLDCPHTQHVVIAHYGPASFWHNAWGLYEPSFRALSQRQGFNLYLL